MLPRQLLDRPGRFQRFRPERDQAPAWPPSRCCSRQLLVHQESWLALSGQARGRTVASVSRSIGEIAVEVVGVEQCLIEQTLHMVIGG